jgi:hypothetical protein
MAGLDVLGLRQPKIEIVDGETLQSSRGDRGSIMPLRDDILSYREMCDSENIQTLQRGMNFRINPSYSVILMSQRANAPYHHRVYEDGITIEYEGHDVPKRSYNQNPKHEDQPEKLPSGRLTQNGLFAQASTNTRTKAPRQSS